MSTLTTLTTDDLFPRDAENRYRLYARRGETLEPLASAGSMQGIGLAILTLYEDCEAAGERFADLGQVGVLDVLPEGDPDENGRWIVNPFPRKER